MKRYTALADRRRRMEFLDSPQPVTTMLEDDELTFYTPCLINLIIHISLPVSKTSTAYRTSTTLIALPTYLDDTE